MNAGRAGGLNISANHEYRGLAPRRAAEPASASLGAMA